MSNELASPWNPGIDFDAVFKSFSRRADTKSLPEIPSTTRSRVIQHWRSKFGNSLVSGDVWQEFWAEILPIIQLRVGTPLIHERFGGTPTPPGPHHALRYVLEGPPEGFLDFLEDVFHTPTFQQMNLDANAIVKEFNQLLRIDNQPFHLTGLVTESRDLPHPARMRKRIVTTAHPKVIMRESEVMHANAMDPALHLLQNPSFANVNKEFLNALEDYRHGDYSDCLTKCCSSFESFMKIVCDQKSWPYKQTDTAASLIKTMLPNTTLEGYFEQQLMIVATLRNKLSSAHGGGNTIKTVPPHLAQYSITVTASAMIMLAAEVGL